MWLVCALTRSVGVSVNGEISERVFFSSVFAGAVGMMPVFEDLESAKAYCKRYGTEFAMMELKDAPLPEEPNVQEGVRLRVIDGGRA